MSSDPYIEGKTTIAPEVLLTIARLAALKTNGVSRLTAVPQSSKPFLVKRGHVGEGVAIEIIDDVFYADLYVILKSDTHVREVSHNLQHEIARAIAEMVGMQVGRVNIHIEDIDYIEAEA